MLTVCGFIDMNNSNYRYMYPQDYELKGLPLQHRLLRRSSPNTISLEDSILYFSFEARYNPVHTNIIVYHGSDILLEAFKRLNKRGWDNKCHLEFIVISRKSLRLLV